MLLNLSDVFKERDKVVQQTVSIELESFDTRMGKYQLAGKSDLDLVLTNLEVGRARVNAGARLLFHVPCDRCLQDVPVELQLEIERYVVPPDKMTEDDEEVDDLSFMEGYCLNTETLLYNEIMENWPAKILCREDCKGICTVCGKNLNEGECGCDRFVPDPRMAAIFDVFKRGKEV